MLPVRPPPPPPLNRCCCACPSADPLRGALVPEVCIGARQLKLATTVNASTWSALMAVGAAIGAAIQITLGISANFIGDSRPPRRHHCLFHCRHQAHSPFHCLFQCRRHMQCSFQCVRFVTRWLASATATGDGISYFCSAGFLLMMRSPAPPDAEAPTGDDFNKSPAAGGGAVAAGAGMCDRLCFRGQKGSPRVLEHRAVRSRSDSHMLTPTGFGGVQGRRLQLRRRWTGRATRWSRWQCTSEGSRCCCCCCWPRCAEL